ncbi:MAG TPA: methenyltetrahydromethanopterin cyclohydrolase [Methyloceanibacter sp.]|nr:methenyltetrahydromethanopterin cyclohydrolase [Methyloceanibacter sp.]
MNKREEIAAARQTGLPSVNAKAEPLVKALIDDAGALRIDVTRGTLGECRIDCGVRAVGGLEAGRRRHR